MSPEDFNIIIKEPHRLDKPELLASLLANYPFCQPARLSYIKSLQVTEASNFKYELKRGAAFVGSREKLWETIENGSEASTGQSLELSNLSPIEKPEQPLKPIQKPEIAPPSMKAVENEPEEELEDIFDEVSNPKEVETPSSTESASDQEFIEEPESIQAEHETVKEEASNEDVLSDDDGEEEDISGFSDELDALLGADEAEHEEPGVQEEKKKKSSFFDKLFGTSKPNKQKAAKDDAKDDLDDLFGEEEEKLPDEVSAEVPEDKPAPPLEEPNSAQDKDIFDSDDDEDFLDQLEDSLEEEEKAPKESKSLFQSIASIFASKPAENIDEDDDDFLFGEEEKLEKEEKQKPVAQEKQSEPVQEQWSGLDVDEEAIAEIAEEGFSEEDVVQDDEPMHRPDLSIVRTGVNTSEASKQEDASTQSNESDANEEVTQTSEAPKAEESSSEEEKPAAAAFDNKPPSLSLSTLSQQKDKQASSSEEVKAEEEQSAEAADQAANEQSTSSDSDSKGIDLGKSWKANIDEVEEIDEDEELDIDPSDLAPDLGGIIAGFSGSKREESESTPSRKEQEESSTEPSKISLSEEDEDEELDFDPREEWNPDEIAASGIVKADKEEEVPGLSEPEKDYQHQFKKDERLKFSEWLQLTKIQPVERSDDDEEFEGVEEEEIKSPEVKAKEASTSDQENQAPVQGKPISKDEQESIIEKFIQEEPRITPKKPKKQELKPASAIENTRASRSVQEDSSMSTETLAQIYAEQGHYKKAIQAYRLLKLKNPEKSDYFADQISMLEKKLNS